MSDAQNPPGVGDEPELYWSLAAWWPLLAPPADSAGDAAYLRAVFGTAARPVERMLDLGCGGANVSGHLADEVELTLVDLSPAMLTLAAERVPTARTVVGDMRSLRLGERFDAVVVHDAANYLMSDDELRALAATAAAHVEPGGLVVVLPDVTAETAGESSAFGGSEDPESAGRAAWFAARYEVTSNGTVEAHFRYLLREPGAADRVVEETHTFGCHTRAAWTAAFTDAGLDTDVVQRRMPDAPRGIRDVVLARAAGFVGW